jgi:SAM-dependent methyltransferase
MNSLKSSCVPSSSWSDTEVTSLREDHRNEGIDSPTVWERVANRRWGTYTSEIARCAILRSHQISGEPKAALEIGCEGGRWSQLLASLGWKMTCVDTDPEALKVCQNRMPTATCVLAKASDEKIPSEADSIDLLLCIEVAPVIQSHWFISEGARVLRARGLIVGVFWNRWSPRGVFVRRRGDKDLYKHPYAHWKRQISNHGFSIIYQEGYCWFPFHRTSDSAYIPFFTQLEKCLGLRKLTWFSPWIAFIAQKRPVNLLDKPQVSGSLSASWLNSASHRKSSSS